MARDNERGNSGFLGAALGITAGALMMKEAGGLKMMSKAIGDIGSTVSRASDDLSRLSFKEMNSSNLGRIMKEHILNDDSTYKTARRSNSLNVNNTKLGISLNRLDNIYENGLNIGDQFKDNVQANYIMQQMQKQYMNTDKSSKEFFEQSLVLTKKVLNKKQQFFDDINPNEVKALIDQFEDITVGGIFDGEANKIAQVFEDAINTSQDILQNSKNEFDTVMKKQIGDTYKEEILNKYSKNNDFFKETMDRAATVGDFFNAVDNETISLDENLNALNTQLRKAYEDYGSDERFLGLKIDESQLRIDKDNQFYSMADLKRATDVLKEELADTIPGKLFGARSMVENQKAPDFFYIGQGTYDKILGSLTGSNSGILEYDHFKIGDKMFQYKNGSLDHLVEADDLKLIGARHGQEITLMNTLFGNTKYNPVTNKAAKQLDLGTKGTHSLEERKGIFDKFKADSDWAPNTVKRLIGSNYDNITSEKQLSSFFQDLKSVNKLYNDTTVAPSNRIINDFKKVVGSESNALLNTLNSDDIGSEVMKLIADFDNFKNKDLKTLMGRYKNDPNIVNNAIHIGDSIGFKNGKNVLDFNKLLKREVFKETLLKESMQHESRLTGYSVTLGKLNDLMSSGADKKNARDLLNWTVLQKEGEMYTATMHRTSTQATKLKQHGHLNTLLKTRNNNAQENEFLETLQKGMTTFAKEATSLMDSVPVDNNKAILPFQNNSYATMRKGVSVLDVLKSLNDDVKLKATGTKFFKQMYAGRNNVEDVTTATLIPFHMLNRLTTPLEEMGLGFSKDSTKSVLNLAKNIGTKRVLPAMAAIYGLSYLNYEAENLTGTSLEESKENVKANFTLGLKTIGDTLGMDKMGRRSRMYNPIVKYWGGDYKDKDEYLHHLEYGYDPVRKGRYWSFGSSSEFRGTKIAYWKPNSLRLAHSNYYDVSVYGSSEEKWKHSWIPTPRHPLAPIRKLLNPYWLEEKHYDDRPYPVTGKLFEEGTPWGAILNPTIGQIIKPQKKMHKEHLQGRMSDVRSILQDRNEAIKAQSSESRVARLNNSGFMPMNFNPGSSPSMNESVFNIKVDGGRVTSAGFQGQDYADSLGSINDARFPVESSGGTGSVSSVVNVNMDHNMKDNQNRSSVNGMIKGLSGLFSSGAIASPSAMSIIAQTNKDIFSKAEGISVGAINEAARLAYNPATEAAERNKTRYLEKTIGDESKSDFVSDMIFSGKQLSGMYGFLAGQVMPERKAYELEHAGNLSSSSQRFWDASIGGIGGNFMEIARRFFPHGNHNIEAVNPIRNTMPEWLPGRFQTGDPFNKVPLGDARLPGAGYETLNKIHSDQYGRYGAFDRYKILADIAPNTEEYKTWKKIAEDTIQDPFLKKEMEGIKDRVAQQTKEHDFYNYMFLNRDLKTEKAVIEEVTNTGKIKILGSDQQYSLAGIKPLNDAEGNSYIHQHLKAGMQVDLKYEDNEFRNRNDKGEIATLVYFGGESISKKMFESKQGKELNDKNTLADQYFALKDSNIMSGHIFEAISHAPIPFIHNKFLRIDSPLESYNKEQVYGSPYSTWDHPIKGFIQPAFQQAWAQGPAYQALGLATFALSNYATHSGMSENMKTLAHGAFALTNPGGFAGGVIGLLPKMNWGSDSSRIGFNSRNISNIGAIVGVTGYALTNLENPLLSAGNFAVAGSLIAKQLDHTTKLGKHISGTEGALIGAAVGVGLSAIKNPEFSLNKLTEKYIPKDTKKKWEIEEYFDRLEYLKYTNLFEKAARKAKREEKVDIRKIINSFEYTREKNVDKIRDLQKQKEKVQRNILDEVLKAEMIKSIDQEVYALNTPEQYFEMGKYTKAALAYKKAADTTIYGLNSYSNTTDVLRALPKYDRDFFLEFAKEKDPAARKKILKTVSPYKKRALQVMWKEDPDEPESNKKFFSTHNLPNMFWSGWNPQVNLDNVKMKTIENEGMLLSDFGMYDSNKSDPSAMMAPEISNINESSSPLAIQRDLIGLLNGAGLSGVDVSVEPSKESGFQLITNITRVASYNMQERVKSVMYGMF